MQRPMIYDEHNGVFRTADGCGFGIIDYGLCVDLLRHKLKICKNVKYRESDLLDFCRDFILHFGVAPNTVKANEAALKSVSEKCYNAQEKIFEIGEFKMKVDLLDPECRDDLLEISFKVQA